jgi:hypothetical protein
VLSCFRGVSSRAAPDRTRPRDPQLIVGGGDAGYRLVDAERSAEFSDCRGSTTVNAVRPGTLVTWIEVNGYTATFTVGIAA